MKVSTRLQRSLSFAVKSKQSLHPMMLKSVPECLADAQALAVPEILGLQADAFHPPGVKTILHQMTRLKCLPMLQQASCVAQWASNPLPPGRQTE